MAKPALNLRTFVLRVTLLYFNRSFSRTVKCNAVNISLRIGDMAVPTQPPHMVHHSRCYQSFCLCSEF